MSIDFIKSLQSAVVIIFLAMHICVIYTLTNSKVLVHAAVSKSEVKTEPNIRNQGGLQGSKHFSEYYQILL